MKYVLGLDLGITSIGWAIYNLDLNNIAKCGVRLFDAAENPKDKSSLAEPRRIARGQRRRIRRRAYRMMKVKECLVQHNIISQTELDGLFVQQDKHDANLYDVYYLRNKALDHEISNRELAQVLIHLAKHRGFKSNRKKDKSVDGKVNDSLKANHELLLTKQYRSIGEMLHLDEKFGGPINKEFRDKKRNGNGEYKVMILRSDIELEAKLILSTQANLGNSLITEEFIDRYIQIFNWQKSFDWMGNIREMVGRCQFEPQERRAAKACFSSEKFIALSKLNNIKYTIDSCEYGLTPAEIMHLFSCVMQKKSVLTFSDLRKELELSDEARFNFVKYDYNVDFFETEKKEKIKELELKSFHIMRKSITEHVGKTTFENLLNNVILYDAIATELTYNKTDDTIKSKLLEIFSNTAHYPHHFTLEEQQQIIHALIEDGVGFDKNISLSLKALYKIIPYLEDANSYDKACELAGYNHSYKDNMRHKKLPSIQSLGLDQELTNPVVIRAISQLRKVINAIIDIYGSPYQINIELARDIGRSPMQRNEITRRQKENRDNTDRLIELFKEYFNRVPVKDELLKYRLWKQQDGKCIYSGDNINLESILHGTNVTQVDHILPFSRSFDDSLNNKVLCLTGENQRKANKIPFEYLGSSLEKWHWFKEHCESLFKHGRQAGFSYKKLQNLLLKEFNQEGFIERNINDTRYISRFCSNYLKDYLLFLDKTNTKPVRSLAGQATAFVRAHWGLIKSREANDLHHAQDACVIAAVTTSIQQKITQFMRARDYGKNQDATYTDPETGEIFDQFPMPHVNFRENVVNMVKQVFVSRMPKRSVSGAVNLDTIRSRKYLDNTVFEYNGGKPFSTINKSLVDSGIKVGKDGEISTLCPTYKLHNPNIYSLIKQQLDKHDNDYKKAFAKPLYVPRKDGTPSDTQIKSVKIIETQNTGVLINNGIADNGGMVRIDVFSKEGKNYIVPVYQKDARKGVKLPNYAITANKPESEWPLINDSYKFQFSLFSKDLIKIVTKKEVYFGYYIGCHRGTAALTILPHDGSDKIEGIGVKINTILEKYQVDVLGNYVKVKHEKRLSFN